MLRNMLRSNGHHSGPVDASARGYVEGNGRRQSPCSRDGSFAPLSAAIRHGRHPGVRSLGSNASKDRKRRGRRCLCVSGHGAAASTRRRSSRAPGDPFRAQRLCALSRPNLDLNQTNFLDRLLDPAVRIATSTPGSDPLGTYSWEVFARADALKPGARATLEAKAKKLVGGGEKTPPLVPGKGAVEGIFLSDQADVMLIYCSAVPALQSEIPSLTSLKLPPALTVEPADGMVILDSKPVALRFVAFVMSEEGQAILRSHGFEPVASVAPDAALKSRTIERCL